MSKRALIEHRPWLLASLVAALAYYFVWNNPIGGLWLILLKGAGVGLLAVYAARRTGGLDGMILTAVLALSALADMALELSFVHGGGLFAASHMAAIWLYLRNRRRKVAPSQKALAVVIALVTPIMAWLLAEDPAVVAYAVILGLMAAAAWTSRFPRYRVGIGALLFVVSDWLIFSRMGPLDLGDLPDMLIWPLYYAGQLMIATGVVQTLRGERPVK